MPQSNVGIAFWVFFLAGALTVILTVTVVVVIIAAQRRRTQQARRFGQRLVEAQEAERARIARELHDDIVQRVALIGGEVSALARLIPAPTSAVSQRIDGLREELHDLADEIRSVARRAHPSTLDHLGLEKSIRALAGELHISDGLQVAVEIQSDEAYDRLPPPAALSLFRVAQEGLRNVARHAGVTAATLRLDVAAGGVTLTVEDRGVGMGVDAGNGSGLGLAGLTERLRAVQGSLAVESVPGSGTKLVAWVPAEGGPT